MNTYFVRAEEKKTVYGVSMIKVQANSPEEAKQKILDDCNDQELIDSWDNCTEDIEYIETDGWEVKKGIE